MSRVVITTAGGEAHFRMTLRLRGEPVEVSFFAFGERDTGKLRRLVDVLAEDLGQPAPARGEVVPFRGRRA